VNKCKGYFGEILTTQCCLQTRWNKQRRRACPETS